MREIQVRLRRGADITIIMKFKEMESGAWDKEILDRSLINELFYSDIYESNNFKLKPLWENFKSCGISRLEDFREKYIELGFDIESEEDLFLAMNGFPTNGIYLFEVGKDYSNKVEKECVLDAFKRIGVNPDPLVMNRFLGYTPPNRKYAKRFNNMFDDEYVCEDSSYNVDVTPNMIDYWMPWGDGYINNVEYKGQMDYLK